jgi:hypothetical protein
MRIDFHCMPLLALLAAACADIPDPQPPSNEPPGDGESMQPGDGEGGDDEPSGGPSTPAPIVRRSCQVAGQLFRDGGAVPSADSCNSCRCNDGNVVCTDIACEPEACDLYLEAPDGVCSRLPDDPCITQDPDCGGDVTDPPDPPDPVGAVCEAGGQTFPDAAEVPSGDSCNTCSCNDGTVACSEAVCDPVFCAVFVEESDGACTRFPLDPCIEQDPDCGSAEPPVEPEQPVEP